MLKKKEGGVRRHAEVSAFARRQVHETLQLELYGDGNAVSLTVTAVALQATWAHKQTKRLWAKAIQIIRAALGEKLK
ncbi:unnamed protein product [Peronospora destructor]|uniref:Uncharacterized protein n=1 Tax=Peronospora destructor TaxID=86335 RepID=A0AAV0V9N5_9STRA|nr:unnamed protein product [Peronospora destructor]